MLINKQETGDHAEDIEELEEDEEREKSETSDGESTDDEETDKVKYILNAKVSSFIAEIEENQQKNEEKVPTDGSEYETDEGSISDDCQSQAGSTNISVDGNMDFDWGQINPSKNDFDDLKSDEIRVRKPRRKLRKRNTTIEDWDVGRETSEEKINSDASTERDDEQVTVTEAIGEHLDHTTTENVGSLVKDNLSRDHYETPYQGHLFQVRISTIMFFFIYN